MHKKAEVIYKFNHLDGDLLVAAFCAHAFSFCFYLMDNYCPSRQAALNYLLAFTYRRESLLKIIIISDDGELLQFLYQLHESDERWVQTLLAHSSLDSTAGYDVDSALYVAMSHGDVQRCAVYILNSVKRFEHLHQLLSHERNSFEKTKPLDNLHHKRPSRDLNVLIRKILSYYSLHMDKISSILFTKGLPFFSYIIQSNDLDLFKDVLDLLSTDLALFSQLIHPDAGGDNILEAILKTLDSSVRRHGQAPVPMESKAQFIDCLMSHCSEEQLKLLFAKLYFLHECSGEMLAYLLTKIDSIDHGCYSKVWASFARQNEGPLFSVVNSKDNSGSTVILEYYVKLYGTKFVNDQLMQSWRCVEHAISYWGNLTLLQYIFPLIRDSQDKVEYFYFELYGKMTCNISLDVFEWLIHQKEIPDTLLVESMSNEKRSNAYKGWFSSALDNLIITTLLWYALVKRLDERELCKLVYANFWEIFIRTADQDKIKRSNVKELQHIHKAKLLLNDWVKLIRKFNNKHLELFTARNKAGQSLFEYACENDSTDLGKVALLNCNHSERVQLIADYKSKATVKKLKEIKELENYVISLQRLDLLLIIKEELIQTPIMKSQTTLFQTMSNTSLAILTVLANIDPCKSFYGDEQGILVIISAELIDTAWQRTQDIIKANAYHPIYKKYHAQLVSLAEQKEKPDTEVRLG